MSVRQWTRRTKEKPKRLNYQRPENADGIIKNLKEGDIGGAGKSLLYSTAEAAPQVAVGAGTSLAAGAAMAGAPIVGGTLAMQVVHLLGHKPSNGCQ